MLKLLDVLTAGDIIQLWRIAGERYIAEQQGRPALMNYPIDNDFPAEAGEVRIEQDVASVREPSESSIRILQIVSYP